MLDRVLLLLVLLLWRGRLIEVTAAVQREKLAADVAATFPHIWPKPRAVLWRVGHKKWQESPPPLVTTPLLRPRAAPRMCTSQGVRFAATDFAERFARATVTVKESFPAEAAADSPRIGCVFLDVSSEDGDDSRPRLGDDESYSVLLGPGALVDDERGAETDCSRCGAKVVAATRHGAAHGLETLLQLLLGLGEPGKRTLKGMPGRTRDGHSVVLHVDDGPRSRWRGL